MKPIRTITIAVIMSLVLSFAVMSLTASPPDMSSKSKVTKATDTDRHMVRSRVHFDSVMPYRGGNTNIARGTGVKVNHQSRKPIVTNVNDNYTNADGFSTAFYIGNPIRANPLST